MDVGCANVWLNRWNSNSSALTADNREDILHNVKQDDGTAWTNEKHSLYLEHLELSFIKQLHQSMGLFAECSEKNKRGKNLCQMQPINDYNTSEQDGCGEKIDYCRSDTLSGVSADSRNPKRMRKHNPLTAADMPELICGAENHWKEGTGQNFVDDDINQNESNTKSQKKKLKTCTADSSSYDQILASNNCATRDY